MKVKQVNGKVIDELISKLDSGDADDVFGYEEEKVLLTDLLSRTIKNYESGSVIIYGWRGSGKSSLLEYCLRQLTRTSSGRRLCIIRLDGLIHNTDALALSVIGRQLEIQLTSASQIGTKLLEKLSELKSFIFILNEFDIFCRRQQTLLYTLFDAVHYVEGLRIIGLTAKTDCTEFVEKRVRSRMSYHSIVLCSPFKSEQEFIKYTMELLENQIDEKLLKPLLSRQYKKSRTPRDLRRFLLEFLLDYEKNVNILKDKNINSSLLNRERKVDQLESITHLELAVICLISKKIRATGVNIFRPIEIYPLLKEIPKQINHSKELFLHVLHRLTDYDLIVINSGQRSNSYISDWTSMSLNVDQPQIDTVLHQGRNTLPTNFSRLLELNA